MWQINLEVQTKAKMKFIKAQKRRNTVVLQALATQRNSIFVKYQIRDLVDRSIDRVRKKITKGKTKWINS